MEKHSTLAAKGLMVSVEQVSIFLQSDNTLVSFFEHSADVIEEPILKRLQSSETVLRQSGDASMVMHAIIDGIVDLAIPIATAYEESIAELELDVLVDPTIAHSKALYVVYLQQACSTLLNPPGTYSLRSFPSSALKSPPSPAS